jgi:ribosomal protein S24E
MRFYLGRGEVELKRRKASVYRSLALLSLYEYRYRLVRVEILDDENRENTCNTQTGAGRTTKKGSYVIPLEKN